MATPSRTVHLRTPMEVINAYVNWNCPHFAIINGKQLLIAYDNDDGDLQEGEQLLTQWVEILNTSGSAGIYTLCIYKGLNGKAIDNSTKYNGSVNFQFHSYAYGNTPALPSAGDPGLKLILDRMEAMQLQITKLQEDQDTDDDDDGDQMIGKITTLLNNPIVAGLIGQLLPKPAAQSRIGQPAPMQPVHQEPGQVSRIAGVSAQDRDALLADALKRLQAKVDDLPDVLQQLATLAEKRPVQFKLYKATLMAMKL